MPFLFSAHVCTKKNTIYKLYYILLHLLLVEMVSHLTLRTNDSTWSSQLDLHLTCLPLYSTWSNSPGKDTQHWDKVAKINTDKLFIEAIEN